MDLVVVNMARYGDADDDDDDDECVPSSRVE